MRKFFDHEESCMRVILASVSLILLAGPAFAVPNPAPAPVLAAGLPAAVVVGGVLLARRFFKKK
jgi:hypothetical protein